jgi:hypothetical protein
VQKYNPPSKSQNERRVLLLISIDESEKVCMYVGMYSQRQKYGINSLKIKQNLFQKNLWTGQF